MIRRFAPKLTVIGGANGAGKSTIAAIGIQRGHVMINPDNIARQLGGYTQSNNFKAMRIAMTNIKENIAQKNSFAFETTLSSKNIASIVDSAKKQGFTTSLVYVGIDSKTLNVNRVADRVKKGGHDVPVADITRRHDRSMANLPKIFDKVHNVKIVDNTGLKAEVVLEKKLGQTIQYTKKLPKWVEKSLGKNRLKNVKMKVGQSVSMVLSERLCN